MRINLTIMNFLQFFILGSWIMTYSAYLLKVLNFSGTQIGLVYSTVGLASIFMPAVIAALADRWFSATRLYAFCHLAGVIVLCLLAFVSQPTEIFCLVLLYNFLYMPTIPLAYAISFRVLTDNNLSTTTAYPPIRVWGTIGFIFALWLVSLSGLELSVSQLFVAAAASLALGLFSFLLPRCRPLGSSQKLSWLSILGVDSFKLLKLPKMRIFMWLSVLVGAALQINNTFISGYLHDFDINPVYANAFGVTHPALLMSLAQISETLFILVIPFLLPRLGIKKVVLLSVLAWIIRFTLLAYGDPSDGLWMILLSMIVFGCAFDFFNISCSIYVNNEAPQESRAGAIALFFIMTMGIGSFIGSYFGGIIIDLCSTLVDGQVLRNWNIIWLTFAMYMAIVFGLVALLFKPQTTEITKTAISNH